MSILISLFLLPWMGEKLLREDETVSRTGGIGGDGGGGFGGAVLPLVRAGFGGGTAATV